MYHVNRARNEQGLAARPRDMTPPTPRGFTFNAAGADTGPTLGVAPPEHERELLERAQGLAGHTLGELAAHAGLTTPTNSVRSKGWAGQLIEALLGATAGSTPQPDFPELGIELKTIPINPNARPRESTHVCVAPLIVEPGLTWVGSLVQRKLARVLWVPILWDGSTGPSDRIVCMPLCWSPSAQEQAVLRRDWEEHIELIAMGRINEITARQGEFLQVRPKAANARTTTWTTDYAGHRTPANPRGFYLRTRFTGHLLAAHFNP